MTRPPWTNCPLKHPKKRKPLDGRNNCCSADPCGRRGCARAIQIYFYNFPQMTGLSIPVSVIADLAQRFPARFTGIKDSSGDLDYARAIVAANASLRVFPSSETVLHHARADGFAGCISATVNVTAPLCAQVWASGGPSNLVEDIARQRTAMAGPALIPGIKHMVSHRTDDAMWRNILPPFLPLQNDAVQDLETALAGLQLQETS